MIATEGLIIERVGPAVVVTIDRPATRNAIDRAIAEGIADAVREADRDPAARGVILAATGDRTFISGGDLNMIAALLDDPSASGSAVLDMFETMSILERASVPVIAAVQGDVLGGGCEVALLCDMVIAESHAGLSFRHAKMGLSPAWGGLTRLVERVGPIEAARLLFTADRVVAEEAARIGLVNEVVAKGTAKTRAIAAVSRIADNPRATVAALKGALHGVREARRAGTRAVETATFEGLWGRSDHEQAVQSFRTKR